MNNSTPKVFQTLKQQLGSQVDLPSTLHSSVTDALKDPKNMKLREMLKASVQLEELHNGDDMEILSSKKKRKVVNDNLNVLPWS